MSKLYPPYIEEKLPAQIGTVLKIPFQFNKTVNLTSVAKISARIKTISTSQWLGTLVSDNFYSLNESESLYEVEFNDLSSLNLNPGQFYKIQLSCINTEETVGYFSSVGIFKYTTQPTLSIEELNNFYTYMGVYNNEDNTEKVYSYQFNLYQNGQLISTTETLIHNVSMDNELDSSYDIWTINQQLDDNLPYTLEYIVNTMNNLTVVYQRDIASNINIQDDLSNDYELIVNNNYENGYNEVFLRNKNLLQISNDFIISRASSEDNFSTWFIIKNISLASTDSSILLLRDFSIKQGIQYQYSIQKVTANMRSQKLFSNIIISDFEDIFLFDGERQLKIRFNPKVTQLKTTILENKIDTIGSKYPFFFRNGNVEYKQFALSGLISYFMDNDELFMSKKDIGFFGVEPMRESSKTNQYLNFQPSSTQLDGSNIFMERNFKTEVHEWLNNGKMKIFKSPVEGNFIIRLMGTSLSPTDTLGRMIHSFTSTAYEVADYSVENLIKYNFI